MRLAGAILGLALAAAPPCAATPDALETAQIAAEGLRGAIGALQAADSARDRVGALTQTIRAYELGLAAVRDGLRQAAIREREIRGRLDGEQARIAGILAAMVAIERAPEPVLLLHPGGAAGAVRSGLLMASVAPALDREAAGLRDDLAELAALDRLQTEVEATLQRGLVASQDARTSLSQAIQDRTDLPTRFLEDPEELQALVASADSLDAFARGIAAMETDIGPPMEDFAGARGRLQMPVLGRVLRRAGEADAAGIRRPGLLVATRPAALVTTPWPATIRYRGPLLDYGNVMILEPAAGYVLVLAGLGAVYGEVGDVLASGAPVGLMGGDEPAGSTILSEEREGGGAGRTETLYIELRVGNEPVDPAEWFAETKDD